MEPLKRENQSEDKKEDGQKNTQINRSLQVLSFVLDGEVYAIDISQIQEVIEYSRVTPVPRTPDFMLGVINLRGQIVPVVDLRKQFAMRESDITVNTCIIIVDIPLEGEKTALGILADSVQEVVELSAQSIIPPPKIGSRVDTEFIRGMGSHEGEFVIILNLIKVFAEGEITQILDVGNNISSEDDVFHNEHDV